MKVLTQFIHLGENPFIRSAWKRKGHLSLSYAFSKIYVEDYPTLFLSMQLMNNLMQDDNTLQNVSSSHKRCLNWTNDMVYHWF